jgi:hypothetical protein
MYDKFQSGFSESANPQLKALQYQTLSEMGYTNIFDMKKIMADPMSNRGYIKNMVSKFRSISGGNSQQMGDYLSQFLPNTNQIQGEDLANMAPGQWDAFAANMPSEITDKINANLFTKGRQGYAVSDVQRATLTPQSLFERGGEVVVTKLSGILEDITSLLGEKDKSLEADFKLLKEKNDLLNVRTQNSIDLINKFIIINDKAIQLMLKK